MPLPALAEPWSLALTWRLRRLAYLGNAMGRLRRPGEAKRSGIGERVCVLTDISCIYSSSC
jgi:hypothetical protein